MLQLGPLFRTTLHSLSLSLSRWRRRERQDTLSHQRQLERPESGIMRNGGRVLAIFEGSRPSSYRARRLCIVTTHTTVQTHRASMYVRVIVNYRHPVLFYRFINSIGVVISSLRTRLTGRFTANVIQPVGNTT